MSSRFMIISQPLMGNGFISHSKGVRSDTMFVSGVFNDETTSPSHRASIPAHFNIDIENSRLIGCLLDIEFGIYHRRGNLESSWYELRWYAHRTLRNVYVMEFEAHLDNNADNVTVTFKKPSIDGSADFDFEPTKEDQGISLLCGETKTPETADTSTHSVCVAASVVPSTLLINKATSGQVFTFVSSFRSSLDVEGAEIVSAVALTDVKNALSLANKGALQSLHIEAWKALWKSGVEITGRPDVGIAVNASLFAILSSVRDDWAYGLAPGCHLLSIHTKPFLMHTEIFSTSWGFVFFLSFFLPRALAHNLC